MAMDTKSWSVNTFSWLCHSGPNRFKLNGVAVSSTFVFYFTAHQLNHHISISSLHPRNCANTFDSDGILLIKARELKSPLQEPTSLGFLQTGFGSDSYKQTEIHICKVQNSESPVRTQPTNLATALGRPGNTTSGERSSPSLPQMCFVKFLTIRSCRCSSAARLWHGWPHWKIIPSTSHPKRQ